MPETAGDRVSVYPVPVIAAGGVPEEVRERTGMAVTVTVGLADTGIARSAVSVSVAVVLWGPGIAVREMLTPTEMVDRDVSAVAVQLRSRVAPVSEHDHPLPVGTEAKFSPAGTVATILGK